MGNDPTKHMTRAHAVDFLLQLHHDASTLQDSVLGLPPNDLIPHVYGVSSLVPVFVPVECKVQFGRADPANRTFMHQRGRCSSHYQMDI